MIRRQIELKKEPDDKKTDRSKEEPDERMMIKRQIAVSFTRRKKRKTGK